MLKINGFSVGPPPLVMSFPVVQSTNLPTLINHKWLSNQHAHVFLTLLIFKQT